MDRVMKRFAGVLFAVALIWGAGAGLAQEKDVTAEPTWGLVVVDEDGRTGDLPQTGPETAPSMAAALEPTWD